MNLRNVAALLRDDATTIKCVHESQFGEGISVRLSDDESCDFSAITGNSARNIREAVGKKTKVYTYRCLRELASNLKEGDAVLVKNATGFSVARVISVDEQPDIDANDNNVVYRWAFQKINFGLVVELEKQDELLWKALQKKQSENLRKQALSSLGINSDEDIKNLMITKQ